MRLIIAVAMVVSAAGVAEAFSWYPSWNWFYNRPTVTVVSSHSGYKVSGGGYYLLSPSHTQSYIVHP